MAGCALPPSKDSYRLIQYQIRHALRIKQASRLRTSDSLRPPRLRCTRVHTRCDSHRQCVCQWIISPPIAIAPVDNLIFAWLRRAPWGVDQYLLSNLVERVQRAGCTTIQTSSKSLSERQSIGIDHCRSREDFTTLPTISSTWLAHARPIQLQIYNR